MLGLEIDKKAPTLFYPQGYSVKFLKVLIAADLDPAVAYAKLLQQEYSKTIKMKNIGFVVIEAKNKLCLLCK